MAKAIRVESVADEMSRYLDMDEELFIMLKFCLAIALAERYIDKSLFGLVVAPSSGGKSEIFDLIRGAKQIVSIDQLTGQTIFSGYKDEDAEKIRRKKFQAKRKEAIKNAETDEEKEAAQALQYEAANFSFIHKCLGKVMLTHDITNIFSRQDVKQIMGHIRLIHDGHGSVPYGNGQMLEFDGIVHYMAGCTPRIDKYTMGVADMGERWLMLRLALQDLDRRETIACKAQGSREQSKNPKQRATAMVHAVLNHGESRYVRPFISDADRLQIARLAMLSACFRTVGMGDTDIRKNSMPVDESPARMAASMNALAIGLAMVDRSGVLTSSSWEILRRVSFSSIPDLRRRVISYIVAHDHNMSCVDLQNEIRINQANGDKLIQDLFSINIIAKDGDRQRHGGHSWKLSSKATKLIDSADMTETIIQERSRLSE